MSHFVSILYIYYAFSHQERASRPSKKYGTYLFVYLIHSQLKLGFVVALTWDRSYLNLDNVH